jgi:membrane-bound lytic murein transglycosylase B
MISILMPLLASAIMISPSNQSPTPQNSSTSSSILQINRTEKEPGEDIVEYLANRGLIQSLKPKKSKAKDKKAKKTSGKTAIKPYPTIDASKYPPRTTYDDVYKAAGKRFGIPWQILYGIHMTETGCRNGPIMSGYGTGAQGPMQFMPGTWRAYGIDGDNDGKADINNAVDAIYGAANYLAKHGTLNQGLRAYGGNYQGTLAYAKERGYTLQ